MAQSSLTGRWNYPTSIRFGAGMIRELPGACSELGMHNPLLVTEAGLARIGMERNAVDSCRTGGFSCGMFSDVKPNPIEENVTTGVNAYRANSHDGVIAFGG